MISKAYIKLELLEAGCPDPTDEKYELSLVDEEGKSGPILWNHVKFYEDLGRWVHQNQARIVVSKEQSVSKHNLRYDTSITTKTEDRE